MRVRKYGAHTVADAPLSRIKKGNIRTARLNRHQIVNILMVIQSVDRQSMVTQRHDVSAVQSSVDDFLNLRARFTKCDRSFSDRKIYCTPSLLFYGSLRAREESHNSGVPMLSVEADQALFLRQNTQGNTAFGPGRRGRERSRPAGTFPTTPCTFSQDTTIGIILMRHFLLASLQQFNSLFVAFQGLGVMHFKF